MFTYLNQKIVMWVRLGSWLNSFKHEESKMCCSKRKKKKMSERFLISFSDGLPVGVAARHGAYIPRSACHSDVSHGGHHALH